MTLIRTDGTDSAGLVEGWCSSSRRTTFSHTVARAKQKDGSWCKTGTVLRKRKERVVEVTDPETEGKDLGGHRIDPNELDIPTGFETARFLLRCYRPGDGSIYYAAGQRNRQHLQRYETGNVLLSPRSEAQAETLVGELAEAWALRQSFFVGIFDKQSGAWVGQLYIGVVSWDTPEFELGYVVDHDHQGQGVIAESARAALKFAFHHLRAHRVRVQCDDTNRRSQRVAERAGFVREGHLRQDHRHPDGTFTGTYLYGLLESEFQP